MVKTKKSKKIKVKIEVSNRHIHLSRAHVEKLFGKGHQLNCFHKLSQIGQFACKEHVNIIYKGKRIDEIRILGPERPNTQIELALTDARHLHLEAPIRLSGDIKGTPGLILEGPKGKVRIKEGAIIALRHIHASPDEAKKLRIKNNQKIKIRICGKRCTDFENIIVRIHPSFRLAVHLDTDEGNAAGITGNAAGEIVR